MKWLSVGVEYAHEVIGGTQIYVHRLNVALRSRGIDAVGAYFTKTPGIGTFEGVPLVGMPQPPPPLSRLASWECVPHGLDSFERLLNDVQPDVVHFHATLQAHPPEYFEMARSTGARTLWTYHAPGQTCLQTALLRNGHLPCDGLVEPSRCTRCGLIWSGLPWPLAAFFGAVDLSSLAPLVPLSMSHPFERRIGTTRFRARLERACNSLDHWVTHAQWSRELLGLNGLVGAAPLELPLPPPPLAPLAPNSTIWEGLPSGLRLLYAGRLLDIKGPQLALQALSGPLRDRDFALVLIAPLFDTPFEAEVRSLVASDLRARLLPPHDPPAILAAMAAADAVIVPSIWKETGPYTVLESRWMGTPVIGSNLAGIAELLENDPQSIMFQSNSVEDLARAIERLNEANRDKTTRAGRAQGFRESYTRAFEMALERMLDVVRR